jgi:hypothetical protein
LIASFFCAGLTAAFAARADVVGAQPSPQIRRDAARISRGLRLTDQDRKLATDETRIEHGIEN